MCLNVMDNLTTKGLNPIHWWRENLSKFNNIALAARKWLCVPATSTPSERVFSICGIVNQAKRSRLTGKSIQSQVFIHNNIAKCDE